MGTSCMPLVCTGAVKADCTSASIRISSTRAKQLLDTRALMPAPAPMPSVSLRQKLDNPQAAPCILKAA